LCVLIDFLCLKAWSVERRVLFEWIRFENK